MRLAAMANVYGGGSGERLLRTTDPTERETLAAVALLAGDLAIKRDERLAGLIGNRVARVLGG